MWKTLRESRLSAAQNLGGGPVTCRQPDRANEGTGRRAGSRHVSLRSAHGPRHRQPLRAVPAPAIPCVVSARPGAGHATPL